MVEDVVDQTQRDWFQNRIKTPLRQWHQRYILELLLRQKPLPPSKDGRRIRLLPSHEKPLIDERRGHAYLSNHIRSSRYTIWDFLPKQLFFQATRLSNFYFICMGVPQAIPGISTTGSFTTILPILVFMCFTILKEAYDDFRRHLLDQIENKSSAFVLRKREDHGTTRTLSPPLELRRLPWSSKTSPAETVKEDVDFEEHDIYQWSKVQWHHIKVGDVLRLKRDDLIPADIVLLHADGENGQAYIETMALDGETNLKSRQAPHVLQACSSIQGIKACDAEFLVEDPNPNLYDFTGRVTVQDKKVPLTLNEVVYRGCTLRNTNQAIAMVVNTGEECKIRMNANHHPTAKKPNLEKFANQIVLTLIVYVVILSAGLASGYRVWHVSTEQKSWYLDNAPVGYQDIIIGYLIMFNNVIPLALYVSLEIVKIGQMIMIQSDVEMYDEKSNTPMKCNTNTILENLGQVGYILSDKTGTLTENIMNCRKFSIAGTAWLHPDPAVDKAVDEQGPKGVTTRSKNEPIDASKVQIRIQAVEAMVPAAHHERLNELSSNGRMTAELLEHIRKNPTSHFSRKAREFMLGVALCHTCLPETSKDGDITFQASSPDELALVRAAQDLGYLLINRSSQSITLQMTDRDGKQSRAVYEILDVIEFSSHRKRMSIILKCPDGRIWLLCKGADSVIIPRLREAMIAEKKAEEVRASLEYERRLERKCGQHETRNSFGERPSLTIRRASSRDGRGRITLELPRPSQSSQHHRRSQENRSRTRLGHDFLNQHMDESTIFDHCFRHLDEFATEGLRTLLFAHKILTATEYTAWKKLYQDATTSLVNRQGLIEEAGELLEKSLDLLGASAIEDKLQEGVPETITNLRRANIRIWVLTGDKRETAINIAHSAQICRPGSEMFILDSTKGRLESQLCNVLEDVQQSAGSHSVAVIDGHTLTEVESETTLSNLFYSLVPLIDSVIVCRASPAQKGDIVKGIRARVPNALTLAIGDGANDISMIQAAHVGVGISGMEGLQASRVADYSIAQFRFLQRLLLVHGRWSYVRTAKFVLLTFWKEFFFYMMQALYQRCNGYTGTSLYESSSLTVLNTLFTSLCVIIMGVFEQDLSPETLLAVPELYVYGQRNKGLNFPNYITWVIGATIEGILVWYFCWTAYGVYDLMGDNGLFAFGDLSFTMGIVWTNWKLFGLETHYKSLIVAWAFSVTFVGWWVWNIFLAGIYTSNISPYDVKNGFFDTFGRDPVWWLTLLVTFSTLAVLELVYKSIRHNLVIAGHWPPWKHQLKAESLDVEDLDLELWQEMEKDPVIRDRLQRLARGANEGDDDVDDYIDVNSL